MKCHFVCSLFCAVRRCCLSFVESWLANRLWTGQRCWSGSERSSFVGTSFCSRTRWKSPPFSGFSTERDPQQQRNGIWNFWTTGPLGLMILLLCPNCVLGVCNDGQCDPHLSPGADQARGVSLHVSVEPWHWGRAGGHVLFQTPVWGGRHPQHGRRSVRPNHPPELRHLQRTGLRQQHDGHWSVHNLYGITNECVSIHYDGRSSLEVKRFGSAFWKSSSIPYRPVLELLLVLLENESTWTKPCSQVTVGPPWFLFGVNGCMVEWFWTG